MQGLTGSRGASLRRLLDRVLAARIAVPVIAVVVLGTVAINEWSHRHTQTQVKSGRELAQSRLKAMQALQRLTDAETAQRGFLITGRAEYLQPYRAAVAALPETLNPTFEFLAQAGSGPEADAARQQIETKLAEMATSIELHRVGKVEEAFLLVASDIGKDSMDRIRGTLDRAFQIAEQQRTAALRAIDHSLELRRWTLHALVLLAAAALVGYIQRMTAEARERESARSQLEDEVQARTADLRALAANLQSVQETERARLSRELHDELGGLLTAAKLDLARAARAGDMAQAAERIANAGRRIDEVVGVKRRIIEDLRPSALEHLGLTKSLAVLCREVGERLGIAVTTRLDEVALGDEAQITVYRLVQEALTNIQKYAKARQVEVTLAAGAQTAEVVVADDGAGFDLRSGRVARHGLAGMRYRVEALGGELTIRSTPGQGTRIVATLPVGAAPAGADA